MVRLDPEFHESVTESILASLVRIIGKIEKSPEKFLDILERINRESSISRSF